MTGYTVHTGTSKKFVSGWDHIFTYDDAPSKTKSKAKNKKKAAKKVKKSKK
ncbi:MAG: hypothetical protein ABGZ53_01610 [Fuerstiella sp.]